MLYNRNLPKSSSPSSMLNFACLKTTACGPRLIIAVLLGGLLLLPGAVMGGTWTLLNGDRLTGELVTETDDVIVIKHDTLGLLEIARSTLATGAVVAGQANVDGNPVPAITGDKKPSPRPWRRQVELGYTQQSGVRSQRNLSIRGQLDGKKDNDDIRATTRLLHSTTNGVAQADRFDADLRWRRELAKRYFVQSLSAGFRDRIRQIDLSLEEQLGVGWKTVATKQQSLNLGAGVAARFQRKPLADGSTRLLGTLFQDYARLWSGGLRFTEEASLAYSGEQSSRAAGTALSREQRSYRFRFAAAFQGRGIGRTIFNVRYEYDYDGSVLIPDYRADQRLTTSLGYLW